MRDKQSAIVAGLIAGNVAAVSCVCFVLGGSLSRGMIFGALLASAIASASSFDAGTKWCPSSWRAMESRRTWTRSAVMGLAISVTTFGLLGMLVVLASAISLLNAKGTALLALPFLAVTHYGFSIGVIVALAALVHRAADHMRGFEIDSKHHDGIKGLTDGTEPAKRSDTVANEGKFANS